MFVGDKGFCEPRKMTDRSRGSAITDIPLTSSLELTRFFEVYAD
jgi:hypothetical protein